MRAPLRSVLLVALYLASFLAAAGLVRAWLGVPESSGMRAKVEFYEADGEGFDVVFAGSSNVMNSILPELFDAELAARGYDVRSYNLGLPGMLAFEADHLLKRVLDRRGDRLRHVFVELTDWRPTPRLAEAEERSIYWHTPERFVALAEAALAFEPFDAAERREFLKDNGVLALYQIGNAGRVHERLARELGLRELDQWALDMDAETERGYIALEDVGNAGADRGRREFQKDIEGYKALVTRLGAQGEATAPPAEYLRGAAARRLALFEGTGVEPIHILLPTSNLTVRLEALRAPLGPIEELWAFNRPDEHRDLFRIPLRFDTRHLQRPGAELLTRMLAERFADHLDAQAAK